MNTSFVYFIGFLVVVGGLAYGAMLAGIPQTWILVGAVVLVGLGIMSTITNTKRREPSGDTSATTTTTTVREE
ncbi:hypothetical protein [Sphingomicrobium marinum]|uniref:hypothetical protein n=1 Tax=Sphingomicrobium marinum TaxID=1227950 RepID=UPI0022401509|nr:hypothetical protein [Sphingomicrobium marinum]